MAAGEAERRALFAGTTAGAADQWPQSQGPGGYRFSDEQWALTQVEAPHVEEDRVFRLGACIAFRALDGTGEEDERLGLKEEKIRFEHTALDSNADQWSDRLHHCGGSGKGEIWIIRTMSEFECEFGRSSRGSCDGVEEVVCRRCIGHF